ncbi:hypothetical protein MMC17_002027 [Xylographa soralifera]|nr:hypothetical protein [Xylographa soralifera]
MPSNVVTKTKRTRASVPKVRTGCRTCKIRHVKCDERKPACDRCSSTGRVCDGYGVGISTQSTLVEDFRVVTLGQSACFNSPSVSIPGNEKERRSFDFFRFQTLQELEISLNTPDWNRLILQASHSSPVIRNVAVAIGSLGERFYINEVLTPDNAAANSCHVFAQLQYQKALQGLRDCLHNKGENNIGLTLLSCFMFVVFEFMQGNEGAALTHLRSGLKILRGFQSGSNKVSLARNDIYVSRWNSDPLMADVARVYSILDMQATLWLGLSKFEAQGTASDINICPTEVEDFTGLQAAVSSLNDQMGQMIFFRRSLPPENTWDPMDDGYVNATRERERLMAQLNKWPIAIKVLLLKIRGDLEIRDLQRVTVMSINHKMTCILLSVTMQDNEAELLHSFENIFEDILRLATSLLQPTASLTNEKVDPVSRFVHSLGGGGPMPVFHFINGIIQPVYFTAVKCRNRSLSRRAITMLSTSPWREGAWDSAAMAKIAERKVLQLEAEGWYDTSRSHSPSKSSLSMNSMDSWSVGTDWSDYYHCPPNEEGPHFCRRCKEGHHGVADLNSIS